MIKLRLTKDAKVGCCFLIFGLLNNLLYVIILSAALDLVGANVSKGVVLLSNIVPSLACKLSASILHVHKFKFAKRIGFCVFMSILGMQWIAWSSSVPSKMLGVSLAAISSSFGEISFLHLSSRYHSVSLPCWSSGTGLAGLFGASSYLVMTTWFNFSVRSTLIISSFLPLFLLIMYFFVLPESESTSPSINNNYTPIESIDLRAGHVSFNFVNSLKQTFIFMQPYLLSHMFPQFLVYFSEYTINIGVAPTLLFPPEKAGFSSFRDFYPTYQTVYQIGVFLSRSSISFFTVPYLRTLAITQFIILLFTILQSALYLTSSYHFVLFLIFVEGLIGGTVYVNVYHSLQTTESSQRELAISTVGSSDSSGIFLASLVSLFLEPSLCHFQADRGRDWCALT
ncbi:battenin CLN3 family protein [Schizosaccharomyces pombe]|uniref:Protein btn1 n=1 Tax=Schizosaccharomyces pombe (strain 972 / ATCC 24843) TaxID=284812 RepID=BTN1_SCHPO|nr:battenin CLN3 family protein [Schizosaccharomyces pombe]Q9US09.1 RecName: Full=Protein btn1 [Schizosaccharomyces pombe 972h-]CAB63796.1 battenin CLN3 family protein [Schizosaccharomyces pombe]|eukprot:NP_593598.1 battenin CLN3 family protein [Schizosaccharomyces pombe]